MREPGLTMCVYDPAGEGKDNDAVVIMQREEWRRGELYDAELAMEYVMRILMCEYMNVNWTLNQKVARLLAMERAMRKWENKKKSAGSVMMIETNGVGYGAASLLKDKVPTTTTIRGYQTVARTDNKSFQAGNLSMPRLAALDNTRMLLDLDRIKAVKDAPGMDLFVQELNSFVWASARRPEAIAGQKDDLIMALTGACWFGTKVIPPITKALTVTPKGISSTTDGTGLTRRLN